MPRKIPKIFRPGKYRQMAHFHMTKRSPKFSGFSIDFFAKIHELEQDVFWTSLFSNNFCHPGSSSGAIGFYITRVLDPKGGGGPPPANGKPSD
jgi:hypothetical protein